MSQSKSSAQSESQRHPNPEVQKMIDLGYPAEDIQELPDGSVTIVPANEMEGTARAVARATVQVRFDKMIKRKEELDYEAMALSTANLPIPPELEKEYVYLREELEEANELLVEMGKRHPPDKHAELKAKIEAMLKKLSGQT